MIADVEVITLGVDVGSVDVVTVDVVTVDVDVCCRVDVDVVTFEMSVGIVAINVWLAPTIPSTLLPLALALLTWASALLSLTVILLPLTSTSSLTADVVDVTTHADVVVVGVDRHRLDDIPGTGTTRAVPRLP